MPRAPARDCWKEETAAHLSSARAEPSSLSYGSEAVKRAFAVFQKGGVIMDVVDGEQARIAEDAGAVAVMALERIPADIKADGGVARSSDPSMIVDVMNSCSVPVMAKSRSARHPARPGTPRGSLHPPGIPAVDPGPRWGGVTYEELMMRDSGLEAVFQRDLRRTFPNEVFARVLNEGKLLSLFNILKASA